MLGDLEGAVHLARNAVLFSFVGVAETELLHVFIGVVEFLVLVKLTFQPVGTVETLERKAVDVVTNLHVDWHEGATDSLRRQERRIRLSEIDIGFRGAPIHVVVVAKANGGANIETGETPLLVGPTFLGPNGDRVSGLLCGLDALDGPAGQYRQFFITLLVAGQAQPAQSFFGRARFVCGQPEVVVRQRGELRRSCGQTKLLACASELAGLVMRNPGVVVQDRGIHASLARLAIPKQGRPVQVVAKQSIAVLEKLGRRIGDSRLADTEG